ncbi:NUDIX hydrolase [Micromonospora aurantiaca (nom. illeg.)]|uniref:NUDIX hydrolase n=1 Tax=Micromonospora aurantiaca (nom. illeg.) TaxID=47850 RepID=UPI00082939F1|nr:NUDIX hydrolase [Micromonospora aurantiaca]SCL35997.1 8-oxo-dGTP diphosphatase [Micromonospora aurantiaca]
MIAKPTVAALAIIFTAAGEVVFVRQQRGPYAGWLLLPGGKIEFGESAQDAARREAVEEAGFEAGELRVTGVYEIRAENGSYHFLMFAFRSGTAIQVTAGGHHVDGVLQAAVDDVQPHPTVMQILNDAGVARYPARDIKAGLYRDGILMRGHLTASAGTST